MHRVMQYAEPPHWNRHFWDVILRYAGNLPAFDILNLIRWFVAYHSGFIVVQLKNTVTLHQARLVLGWVTVCGQVYQV